MCIKDDKWAKKMLLGILRERIAELKQITESLTSDRMCMATFLPLSIKNRMQTVESLCTIKTIISILMGVGLTQ
jgi:hypothetical protein